jgi:hypothetical protein
MANDNLTLSLLRPDDLLSLRFEFVNLTLDTAKAPPVLVRIKAGQPTFIIVEFAPQHIAEQAFLEDNNGPINLVAPPISALLSGSTRLVFKVPEVLQTVPLTISSLLDWAKFVPSLVSNALTATPIDSVFPSVGEPSALETAIELPYRLLLSPDATAGWKHAINAVTRNGRTELWHTRLGVATNNGVDESLRPILRAIWARDFASNFPRDLTLSLTGEERKQIARLTSDFNLDPQPLNYQRLVLSALGGWTDIEGSWDSPSFNLTGWHQVIAAGRDQYIRVDSKGFLWPFGHRAAKIQVWERKLQTAPNGTRGEYLMKFEVVVVTEPVRDYTGNEMTAAYAFQGREMPFKRVHLKTLTTPPLSKELNPPDFPMVGGVKFNFYIIAEGYDNSIVDFSMPLMFVSKTDTNIQVEASDRTALLRNQMVVYAPSQNSGDTHLKTMEMTFEAVQAGALTPTFLPKITTARVSIQAIDSLLGASGASSGVLMTFHDVFLTHGFDTGTNPSETFAKFVRSEFEARTKPSETFAIPLSIPAEKAGVVTPNLSLDGLSRKLGPVPKVDTLVEAVANPNNTAAIESIIQSLDGNLLGGIALKDVISAVTSQPIENQIPALITRQLPDSIQTSFTWEPKLSRINDPTNPASNSSLPLIITEETHLKVEARSIAPLNGSAPAFIVDGILSNFGLNLNNVVVITLDELRFHVERGKKTDLHPAGVHIGFVGPLSFFNQLAELMPADGFSDLPAIQVAPDGITAGYALGIPTAGVGAFSLENIALSAAMELPFERPVGLRLAFSERYHPFLVTLSLIGGGGFLAVILNTNGIEKIEASLELGGNITISLGIVEANAHVMMGFHFSMRQGEGIEFTAYIRVGASVDLLGIISISVEFYLGLSFIPKSSLGDKIKAGQRKLDKEILGIVTGIASVTIGVHVLLFDKSFTLTFERTFVIPARANIPVVGTVKLPILADPSFEDMVSVDDWQTYCEAFA